MAAKLKELARQKKTSFKREVNEVIRAGLAARSKPLAKVERFHVKPSHCGFRPGIDTGKLHQLLDELEAGDFRSESRP